MSATVPTRVRQAALLAALLGGLGAVAAEVVFTRRMAMLFGVTAPAVATVVGVYLGGMALGSVLGGRFADRLQSRAPWLYLAAEGFALVWALLFLPLTRAFDAVSLQVPLDWAVGAAAVGTLVLVGPAAMASGATFPALSRVVGDESDVRRLVAANTLGAAVGSVLAGFHLPHLIGYSASLWVAGALALTAGLLMVAVTRGRAIGQTVRIEPAVDPISPRAAARVYAMLGATAMVAELGWTRLLEQTGPNPGALTFPLVLTAYLLGYGIGGMWVEPRLRKWGERWGLATCLVLSGGACVVAVGMLPWIPPEAVDGHQVGWGPHNQGIFHYTGVLVSYDRLLVYLSATLVPGIASGAGFPLVASALTRSSGGLGAGVGTSWAAGTLAAVIASLWMGFLPSFGPGTIHLLVAFGVASLAGAAVLSRRAPLVALPVVGACAFLVPSYAGLQIHDGETLLHFSETASGPTAVTTAPSPSGEGELRHVYTHGERVSGFPLRLAVPLLLHPSPRRVVLIAFGTGVNVKGMLQDPAVEEVACVDIDPSLPRMAEHVPFVGPVFDDPRARFVHADGRHFLRLTEPRWDIIYDDVATYAQYVELGTIEFFELARSRLAPGGMFVAKLHSDTITPEGQARFLQTFLSVFPNTLLFDAHGALPILVGMEDDHLDYEAFVQRATDTADIYGGKQREQIETMTVLRADDLAQLAHGPVNTDDRPMALRHILHGPFVSRLDYDTSGQTPFFELAESRGQTALVAAFGEESSRRRRSTERTPHPLIPRPRSIGWGRVQVTVDPSAHIDW